jgi:hypothetical protein
MNKNMEEPDFGTPPSIQHCRAADIGVTEYGECLRGGPNTCIYAVPFGYCFLCHHPQLEVILHQTYKLKKTPAHLTN